MDYLANLLGLKEKEDQAPFLSPLMMQVPQGLEQDANVAAGNMPTGPMPPNVKSMKTKVSVSEAAKRLQGIVNPDASKNPEDILNTRMRDFLDSQKKGISGLEDQMGSLQKPEGVNPLVLALAAASDTLGNNPNKNVPGLLQLNQQSQDKFDEKKMKYMENIQKAKDSLSKEEISFLGKQIADKKASGQESDLKRALIESSINRNNAVAGFNTQGRGDMYDKSAHQKIVKGVADDKFIGQRMTQYQNLQNALAATEKPDIAPVQQVHELQQAIRKNMGISGSSGVSERADTYINSLGMEGAKIRQFITGKPVDVAQANPELIHHLKEVAKIEMANVKEQSDKRIKMKTAGYDNMLYNHRPELRDDLNKAAGAAAQQFSDESTGGSAPKVGEIRDGYIFLGGEVNNPASWKEAK